MTTTSASTDLSIRCHLVPPEYIERTGTGFPKAMDRNATLVLQNPGKVHAAETPLASSSKNPNPPFQPIEGSGGGICPKCSFYFRKGDLFTATNNLPPVGVFTDQAFPFFKRALPEGPGRNPKAKIVPLPERKTTPGKEFTHVFGDAETRGESWRLNTSKVEHTGQRGRKSDEEIPLRECWPYPGERRDHPVKRNVRDKSLHSPFNLKKALSGGGGVLSLSRFEIRPKKEIALWSWSNKNTLTLFCGHRIQHAAHESLAFPIKHKVLSPEKGKRWQRIPKVSSKVDRRGTGAVHEEASVVDRPIATANAQKPTRGLCSNDFFSTANLYPIEGCTLRQSNG
jgi:hypothetical protein